MKNISLIIIEETLFVGIYGSMAKSEIKGNPKAVRKHILKTTFGWNILKGNLFWCFLQLPYNMSFYLLSYSNRLTNIIENMDEHAYTFGLFLTFLIWGVVIWLVNF
jgi:hypothetical protein